MQNTITHSQTVTNLGCTSADNGLLHLGDLVSGADDAVASAVLDILDILGGILTTLPDLDFASATNDANAHRGEEVVCGVGVIVDTAVEHSGSVLADTRGNQSLASRMILDEVGDIVYDTSYGNEATAALSLGNIIVPFDDRKLLKRNTPVELGSLLVKLLLELLNTALFDFVGTELLEVIGEAELLPCPDAPLGRIVLPPGDGVPVVAGELVVEVVVALTKSDKSSDDVITRRVAVVKGLVAEPVSQRVDAEGGLLDEEDAEDTSVDESTEPVAPAETSDERREDKAHEEDDLEVVAVLPDDDLVLIQVGDVGTANTLGVLLHDHPAKVRVHETLADGVRVLGGVGISVVSTMVTRPPSDGALDSTTANGSKEDLQRQGGAVALVSPETMVASRDAETSPVVVDDGPDGGLEM